MIVLLVAGAVWAWRRGRDATANATDAEEGDRLLGVGGGGGGTEGEERPGLGGLRRRVSFWVYNAFLPDSGSGGGGGGGADTGAAGGGTGGYGTIEGGGAGGYGSDGSRDVVGRVDSAESFGSGGLDDGLEERRRRILERG